MDNFLLLNLSDKKLKISGKYGIIEAKADYGLQEMVHDFNQKLSNMCKSENSIYLYDLNGFVARFGQNNVFDYRQYFFGDVKISLNYIPFLVSASHEKEYAIAVVTAEIIPS